MPSVTRKPWSPFAKRTNRNDQANSPVGSFCSTTMQGLIRLTQSRHNHGSLAEIQVKGSQSSSIQSRPLSLWLHYFWSPKKALRGKRLTSDDDVRQCMQTGSQRSPGNFTRQSFTTLCRSGTTATTNTSDTQVLVSVPRPPACFFFNAHIYYLYMLGQKSWQLFFFSTIPVRWENVTYTDERTRC